MRQDIAFFLILNVAFYNFRVLKTFITDQNVKYFTLLSVFEVLKILYLDILYNLLL
jgi:hypothetical protein